MKDGSRWRFDTTGDPLPFEKVAQYSKARIAERFTVELAAQYAKATGINVRDQSNWLNCILASAE